MGAFLDKPKTEKQNTHGSGYGLSFGLSSMQGWRVEMEDAHSAAVGLPCGPRDWSFFAVFDGHAGSRVAFRCAEHLLGCIAGSPAFAGASRRDDARAVKDCVREGFLRMDEELRGTADCGGSTAVALLVSPRRLYFINCGDSRAVLSRAGRVHLATRDHKPSDPLELERIRNAGGSVTMQRVNGSLAVSRALGDFDYKRADSLGPAEQQVSPEPDVYEVERADNDEFAVLACDGIWDVVSSEELCAYVRSRLQVWDDLEKVCGAVLDTCLHKGSRDNMSVLLVCFPNRPGVSEEAVRREEELDKYLERRVGEIMQSREHTAPSLDYVLQMLTVENIPDLPPGGGIASKREVIEAEYKRLNPHGEEDEDSQGREDGSSTAHLLEALRQFRINHRGEYRQVLEGALSSFRQSCGPQEDSPAADSTAPEGSAPPEEASTPPTA